MRRILLSVVLLPLGLCLSAPAIAIAQSPDAGPQINYAYLFQNFSEDGLTRADKRFLQAALAFEGDYAGLLDGDWGALSRRALDAYARREFNTPAETWHMAALALGLVTRIDSDGWSWHHFGPSGLSMLFPEKTARLDAASADFVNWRHSGSSLAYSLGILSRSNAEDKHAYTLGRHQSAQEPYVLRQPNLAVTRIRRADGAVLYARSDYIDGAWSSVMLSADARDTGLLSAVAASLTPGRAPPLLVTKGGKLDAAILGALDVLQRASDTAEPPAPPAPPLSPPVAQSRPKATPPTTRPSPTRTPTTARRRAAIGTGSGFYVSAQGHVLTNAHVISACTTIQVDGKPAQLMAMSSDDLALLGTETSPEDPARFAAQPARLNTDVTAVGYPLSHLLGGLNVTRGAVSSMTGLSGDRTTMQITAPVQPGNSGGPLVSPDGSVVGVVVSKLDALGLAEKLGDIPQNVNFAIRAKVAQQFLAGQGIAPLITADTAPLRPEDLAERAAGFTVFVECFGP